MPHADKDDRFQPITLEWEYRRLSRGKRLAIELSVGMAILAMIPIGVSMQLPPWLQLIGWAILLSSLVGQSVLVVRWWRERERARAAREANREIRL